MLFIGNVSISEIYSNRWDMQIALLQQLVASTYLITIKDSPLGCWIPHIHVMSAHKCDCCLSGERGSNRLHFLSSLRLFQKFDNFRILVCGGDGSVGWVLSEIDKLSLHKQASVYIYFSLLYSLYFCECILPRVWFFLICAYIVQTPLNETLL